MIERSEGGAVHSSRRSAWIALAILVPAPTIGTTFGLLGPDDDVVGEAVYVASKVWLFGLPLIWLLLVDRRSISLSPPRQGGTLVATAIGLGMLAVIVGGYLLFGHALVDSQSAREIAEGTGLVDPRRFILFAAYITFINALLEEYVWRWFVFEKCEIGLSGRPAIAVLLAALFFTVHHTVALAIQFDWIVVVLGSIGVFVAAAIWSWMYQRYRSVWVPYISHILADIGVFIVGWMILFPANG